MFKEIRDNFLGISLIAVALALTQFPELGQYQDLMVWVLALLGAFIVLATQMGWKAAALTVAGELADEYADDAGRLTTKYIKQGEQRLELVLSGKGIVLDLDDALDEDEIGVMVEEMLIALGKRAKYEAKRIRVEPKSEDN